MIDYLIIDVDGTLTDGGIYYDENGNEMKKFSVKDAAGIFAAHNVGIKTIVLTGRECSATERRMTELQINFLYQGVKDKADFLKDFMHRNHINKEDVAYIGDDLNDFECMKLCGFVGCPKDAAPEIKAVSNYISEVEGGKGAVRDIICHILKERNQWKEAISKCYKISN